MKIKLSKSQWKSIGQKAGWFVKQARTIPDDGYMDGGTPYTDEEMDLIEKQEVDEIKAIMDRPKKIQALIDLYSARHPFASEYETKTLWNDIGQMTMGQINGYVDQYVYNWGKKKPMQVEAQGRMDRGKEEMYSTTGEPLQDPKQHKKFRLEFSMENQAFEERPELEIERILEDVKKRLSLGRPAGAIFDINGNTIGFFEQA